VRVARVLTVTRRFMKFRNKEVRPISAVISLNNASN